MKSSVWSLEGLLPLSTNFYKNLLYLLTKLPTFKKISLHASVYNNAVTTEAAKAFINLTVIYDIKITQGKII